MSLSSFKKKVLVEGVCAMTSMSMVYEYRS